MIGSCARRADVVFWRKICCLPSDHIGTLRTTTYRAPLVVQLLARNFEAMRHYSAIAACLLSVRHTDRTGGARPCFEDVFMAQNQSHL